MKESMRVREREEMERSEYGREVKWREERASERHPTQLDIQLSERLSYQRHCTTEM